MNLSLSVLLVSLCQVLALGSKAQTASISEKDTPLVTVLDKIAAQTGYYFLYDDQTMAAAHLVTAEMKNIPFEDALRSLFVTQPLQYTIKGKTVVIKRKEKPIRVTAGRDIMLQEWVISGTIVDEAGRALEGVTVQVKGTQLSVKTDESGKYTIQSLEQTASLVFSYVGMRNQEIQIGERSIINVIMVNADQSLDEVVVVGYGTQLRESITTSISRLDNSVLENVPYANVTSALQGNIPGVRVQSISGQPGATPRVIIRGGTSINNPNGSAPLYIIDGVMRTDMNDINSDDIETLQVLKDAASTAIYGARGSNGIVIITTKTGKSDKTEVTYNYDVIASTAGKTYDLVSTRDFIYFQRLGIAASASKNPTNLALLSQATAAGTGNDLTQNTLFTTQYLSDRNRHKLLEGWESMTDPLNPSDTIIFKGTDFQSTLLGTGLSHNHTATISGGSERANFYAGVGYLDNEGTALNTNYKRYSVNLNSEFRISDKARVFSRVIYTSSSNSQVPLENIFKFSIAAAPTTKYRFEDGSLAQGQLRSVGNPEYILNTSIGKNNTENFTVAVGGQLDILPSLTFNPLISLYKRTWDSRTFNKAFYNGVSLVDARDATGAHTKYIQPQADAVFSYIPSFSDSHNISSKFGFSFYQRENTSLDATGRGAASDLIPTLNASAEAISVSGSDSRLRMFGYFASLNYDYEQKYLLTFNARYDGASNLGKNSKWGFFPGVSIGWNLHKEKFWQSIPAGLLNMKLRASYGVNGNISGLSDYQAQGEYIVGQKYGGNAAIQNSVLGNEDLRWEQSKTINIGVDFGFLNQRVNGMIDVYRRVTDNLLTSLSLPHSSGVSSILTNFGSLENKGFELELSANVFSPTNSFQWLVSFNSAKVNNKILRLPFNGNPKNRVGGVNVWDSTIGDYVWLGGLQEGGRLGDMFAYKQLGIYRTDEEAANGPYDTMVIPADKTKYGGDVNWADLDGNDIIDAYDRVNVGNPYPTWTGGFANTFSYKGLNLTVRLDYTAGHVIYNETRARFVGQFSGNQGLSKEVFQSWKTQGDNTNVPRFYWADQNVQRNLWRGNSYYYESGDFLAIREVTLAYSLPTGLIRKAKFQSIRLYITGNNLQYFTSYKGLNPEEGGRDDGRYPIPKNVIFGINVSF